MVDRCLYQVLGISRDSSPEDIRSTYRCLALKLHPDKIAAANGGVITPAATAAFQELLHAYTILSDPDERDYYDTNHLFDPDDHLSDPEDDPDECDIPNSQSLKSPFPFFNIDIVSYLTDSAFNGFTDSGHGFYMVYDDIFIKIHAFELRFGAASPAPKLGNLDSPYSQVEAFYKYWLSFSTVLEYFGGKLTSNPKVNSLLEEKNKKAKTEHNDLVRSLATFAKKRDKRVIGTQAKKKQEAEVEKRCDEKTQRKEESKRVIDKQAKEKPEAEQAKG